MTGLQFAFQAHLVRLVDYPVLVFQQPVYVRLVVHGLGDGLAVDFEQRFVIACVIFLAHHRIQPHRDDKVIDFSLGMSPARTASRTPWAIAPWTVPIRRLVYALGGHLADHQGQGTHLNVGV